MGSLTVPSQTILFLKTTSTTTNCSLLTHLSPKFSGIGISSKVSWSNHSIVCSRYSRKQFREMHDRCLRNFLCKVFDSSKDGECSINEGKSCSLTKLIRYVEDCNVMITKKKPTPSKFMLYQSHLKLMMLWGFFTLQGILADIFLRTRGQNLLYRRFGDTGLPVDNIVAAFLLVYFGVSTLLEDSSGDGLKAEEQQKEAELAVSEFSGNGAGF